MKRLVLAIVFVAIFAVVAIWQTSARPPIEEANPQGAEASPQTADASQQVADDAQQAADIPADVLQGQIDAGTAPVILDVRTAEEYAAGHVPGALNMSHDELADRLQELDLDPTAELVVYCRSGRRAGIAEQILGKAGFTQLRDLDGHWLQWVEDGRPTE